MSAVTIVTRTRLPREIRTLRSPATGPRRGNLPIAWPAPPASIQTTAQVSFRRPRELLEELYINSD
jgi:hypothetical protein